MVINIPIQVDEAMIEKMVREDYKKQVGDILEKRIIDVLMKEDRQYSWQRNYDPQDGMRSVIERRVDDYIENHAEEVVEMAASRLEERLRRRKRIKEVGEREA